MNQNGCYALKNRRVSSEMHDRVKKTQFNKKKKKKNYILPICHVLGGLQNIKMTLYFAFIQAKHIFSRCLLQIHYVFALLVQFTFCIYDCVLFQATNMMQNPQMQQL